MAIKDIVLRGYAGGTRYIPTRGYLGADAPVVLRRGCVHGMDAARWSVRCADSAVTNVTGADEALWSVKGRDEAC